MDLKLSTPPAQAEQVHGGKIVKAVGAQRAAGADGIFTFDTTPLLIRSADCAPVFVFDFAGSGFLCALHCGRVSIVKKIISKSLNKILAKNKINPKTLKVFIGPHIRRVNYPIGKPAQRQVTRAGFSAQLALCGRKKCFDLTSAIISELEKIAVSADNIFDCGINTYIDKRFYSLRRFKGKLPGVFATVAFKNG